MVSRQNRQKQGSLLPGQALLCAVLAALLLCVSAQEVFCADVTLAWSRNEEPDLAGYRVFSRQPGETYNYADSVWEGWIEVDEAWKEPVNTDEYGNPWCVITDLENDTTHCFVVRAFDTSGNESSDSNEACWTAPGNTAPVALAGPDQTRSEGTTVLLNASSSYDPDGSIIAYEWRQTAGTTVTLSDSYAISPSFVAPQVDSAGQVLRFDLVVTDNDQATDTDFVLVNVEDSPSPPPPPGPQLVEVRVSGPSSVYENTMTDYTATAVFDNGNTEEVTGESVWAENSDYANITDNGVLVASWVGSDQSVTVRASYTFSGVTEQGAKAVTIRDVPSPPYPPCIVSPEGAAERFSLTPELKVGCYDDPDGDPHDRTHWQVSAGMDSDDWLEASLLLDINSDKHLLDLPVPEMVLDEDTSYFWRARFRDQSGSWSEWSAIASFQTEFVGDDLNNNGIPDHQEVDADVDLDGNGVFDVNQADIKCVKTAVGWGQIGVQVSPGLLLERIHAVDPESLVGGGQRPDEVPLGMVGFKLRVPQPGDSCQVTVFLSESAPENAQWYKFDSITGWQPHQLMVVSAFSEDRRSVTLLLEDGEYGDADGVGNGVIVDPGGIGISYTSPDPNPDNPGGGGGGGCFISTVSPFE